MLSNENLSMRSDGVMKWKESSVSPPLNECSLLSACSLTYIGKPAVLCVKFFRYKLVAYTYKPYIFICGRPH